MLTRPDKPHANNNTLNSSCKIELLLVAFLLDVSTVETQAYHVCGGIKKESGNRPGRIMGLPIVRKWWEHMADIMEVNPDNSPQVTPLKEVFHMD